MAGGGEFHSPRHCPCQCVLWFGLGFEAHGGMLFLQEIDAITAPAQPAEPTAASSSSSSVPPPMPPRPEPRDSGTGPSSGTANGTGSAPAPEWQYDTQCSLAGGECHSSLQRGC